MPSQCLAAEWLLLFLCASVFVSSVRGLFVSSVRGVCWLGGAMGKPVCVDFWRLGTLAVAPNALVYECARVWAVN
jgi:hypothetical protein